MTTTLSTQRVLVGRAGATKLLRWGSGYTHDSTKYNLKAKSDPLAPAGAGGECAFHRLYVYVVHEVLVPIKVTPYLDGVALDSYSVTLALPAARTRRIIKVPIVKRFPSSITDYATLGSFAARGCWMQVQVETEWGAETPGFVRLEGVEVERTILSRTGLTRGSNK